MHILIIGDTVCQWVRKYMGNSVLYAYFFCKPKAMATHSSVLAWRIPAMGEPGGLPTMGSLRVGHGWSDLAAAAAAFQKQVSFRICIIS